MQTLRISIRPSGVDLVTPTGPTLRKQNPTEVLAALRDVLAHGTDDSLNVIGIAATASETELLTTLAPEQSWTVTEDSIASAPPTSGGEKPYQVRYSDEWEVVFPDDTIHRGLSLLAAVRAAQDFATTIPVTFTFEATLFNAAQSEDGMITPVPVDMGTVEPAPDNETAEIDEADPAEDEDLAAEADETPTVVALGEPVLLEQEHTVPDTNAEVELAPEPSPKPFSSVAEEFSTRREAQQMTSPAREGFRGMLNKLGFKLDPGSHEKYIRHLTQMTQGSLDKHVSFATIDLKGGSSKTTVTLMLAETLGRMRGGNILAWDNNENVGTLALQSAEANHDNTVADLYENLAELRKPEQNHRLSGFVREQGDGRFVTLASQNRASSSEIITGDAFRELFAFLRQFYSIIGVDTGNSSAAGTWQAAVDSADALVLTAHSTRAHKIIAGRTIDALIARGHEEKLRRGIAIITVPNDGDPKLTQEVKDAFAGYVSDVVLIPYDQHLSKGDRINFDLVSSPVKEAYLEAAAYLVQGVV